LAKQIEKESQAINIAKDQVLKFIPFTFENDETAKQLLARSRCIIAKTK
jgi:transposase